VGMPVRGSPPPALRGSIRAHLHAGRPRPGPLGPRPPPTFMGRGWDASCTTHLCCS
jgi:hypothetical protein